VTDAKLSGARYLPNPCIGAVSKRLDTRGARKNRSDDRGNALKYDELMDASPPAFISIL